MLMKFLLFLFYNVGENKMKIWGREFSPKVNTKKSKTSPFIVFFSTFQLFRLLKCTLKFGAYTTVLEKEALLSYRK